MRTVEDRFDIPRASGERKPAGLYLLGEDPKPLCRFFPFPISLCPCCGQGIVPTTRWTWIQPRELFAGANCPEIDCGECRFKDELPEAAGLLWIKEKFYPFASDFSREAYATGISVKVLSLPTDFVLGSTWVFFAHTKAVFRYQPELGNPTYVPGVFHAFLPNKAEYVVRGSESRASLSKIIDRGVIPVRIRPRQASLFPEYERELALS